MITKVTTFNLFLPSRVYFFDSSISSQPKSGNDIGRKIKIILKNLTFISAGIPRKYCFCKYDKSIRHAVNRMPAHPEPLCLQLSVPA